MLRRLTDTDAEIRVAKVLAGARGKSVTVGRKGVDFVIHGAQCVSRRHASFQDIEGVIHVEDCKSSNGTYVRRHRSHALKKLQSLGV